jgi:DNA-binding NtrC family response regulator
VKWIHTELVIWQKFLPDKAEAGLNQKKKALIVDDEESLRDVINQVLLIMNVETFLAESGDEALNIARERRDEIGFLLLDLFMPGMTGVETYKRISKELGELPVIFMSGIDRHNDPELDVHGNKKLFLKKPFLLNELKELVLKVIAAS